MQALRIIPITRRKAASYGDVDSETQRLFDGDGQKQIFGRLLKISIRSDPYIDSLASFLPGELATTFSFSYDSSMALLCCSL